MGRAEKEGNSRAYQNDLDKHTTREVIKRDDESINEKPFYKEPDTQPSIRTRVVIVYQEALSELPRQSETARVLREIMRSWREKKLKSKEGVE